MSVTMTKLAEEVGVSVAVVSRFLRKDPTLRISESCRRNIVQTKHRLGGVKVARIRRRELTKRIILPVYRVFARDTQFFAETEFFRSFETELKSQGFQVNIVFFSAGEEMETIRRLLATPGECDGLLILGGFVNNDLASMLELHNFPHVTTDERAEWFNLNTVRTHSAFGIRQAIKYLQSLGHVKIGYIGTSDSSRYSIFIAQMIQLVASFDDSLNCWVKSVGHIMHPDEWSHFTKESLCQYLETNTPPSAFICANDNMALGAVEALKEKGLEVGSDVSLVGYDNYEQRVLHKADPILTTIDNPGDIVGRHAAIRLLNQIVYGQMEISQERIPTKLIIRKTTGPCR